MSNHIVKILQKDHLNHDVIRFKLEKPEGYSFKSGQAIELLINDPESKGPSPFTFTNLPTDNYLELMIKIYKERNGVTSAISDKQIGDEVSISDPWDSFENKGPGIFIAGGAGITPFIALLRQLKNEQNIGNSQLFFYNKTRQDIFLEEELKALLGERYSNILTKEMSAKERHEQLSEKFFEERVIEFGQPFYVCGPPGFVERIQESVSWLGTREEMINVSL